MKVSLLRIIAGATLGGGALWLALRDTSASQIAGVLKAVDPGLATAALAATIASVFFVALRWKLLFGAAGHDVRFWLLFRAMVVGQMLNIVAPIRVGEVARLYRVVESTRIEVGYVLATLAAEKVLEITVFSAIVVSLTAIVTLPSDVIPPVAHVLIAAAAGIGMLWVVTVRGAAWISRLVRVAHVPQRFAVRIERLAAGFVDGLQTLQSRRLAIRTLTLSAAAMIASAVANQWLLDAFRIDAPWWTGLLLLVMIQVGAVPPSLPGRLGIFNYVTVLTLTALGLDRTSAASYSIALYAIGYLPKIIGGLIFLPADTGARSMPRWSHSLT